MTKRKTLKYGGVDPKGAILPRGNVTLWASGNPKDAPEGLRGVLDKIKGKGSGGITLAKMCGGSRHTRWKVRQLLKLRLIKVVAEQKEVRPKTSKPKAAKPNAKPAPPPKPTASEPAGAA